jgi:glucose 1-dehydrogenase
MASRFELTGKRALITGAARGIGHAVAKAYLQAGAECIMLDAAPGIADAAAKLGAEHGGKATPIQADVTDEKAVAAAMRGVRSLDILVNNAGVEKHAPFWDVTEADYDKVLDVNLKGAFFATQAMVRHLQATSRKGRIVNISSVHEDMPFPNFAAYCVSKGGMRMMTRNLAVELGPLGIGINNIAPGAIETPINTALLNNPQKLSSLLGQIPLNRLGQPDDVASLAVFLASDEASYVTGSTFYVDGGLSVFYQEQ